MERTLIEAEEAFGAPSADEEIDAAVQAILACGRWIPADIALPLCVEEAEKAGSRNYTAALAASMAAARAGSSPDPNALSKAVRDLFHAAAKVGEMRMLVRLAEGLTDITDATREAADGRLH